MLDKDILRPGSRPVLDRAIAVLRKYPDVRIEISGHIADHGQIHYYGVDLAGRRATAVKRYLVEHGIGEARVETRSGGWDEPIATNKTEAGRKKNRRIEFTILVP